MQSLTSGGDLRDEATRREAESRGVSRMQNIVKCIFQLERRHCENVGSYCFNSSLLSGPISFIFEDIRASFLVWPNLALQCYYVRKSRELSRLLSNEAVMSKLRFSPGFLFFFRARNRLSTSAQSSFHLWIPSAKSSLSLSGIYGRPWISRIRSLSLRYVSSHWSSAMSVSLLRTLLLFSLGLQQIQAHKFSRFVSSCMIVSAPSSAFAMTILWRYWELSSASSKFLKWGSQHTLKSS